MTQKNVEVVDVNETITQLERMLELRHYNKEHIQDPEHDRLMDQVISKLTKRILRNTNVWKRND